MRGRSWGHNPSFLGLFGKYAGHIGSTLPREEAVESRVQSDDGVLIPTLSYTSCVTFNVSLTLSVPQFPHLLNGAIVGVNT